MYKSERNDNRYIFCEEIEFLWTDQAGSDCSAIGSGINISRVGMAVNVAKPIPEGISVTVRLRKMYVLGEASVVYSLLTIDGFRVGLRFSSPIVDGEVSDPIIIIPSAEPFTNWPPLELEPYRGPFTDDDGAVTSSPFPMGG